MRPERPTIQRGMGDERMPPRCCDCGADFTPGQPLLLDARRYDPALGGSDWRWRHADCREASQFAPAGEQPVMAGVS